MNKEEEKKNQNENERDKTKLTSLKGMRNCTQNKHIRQLYTAQKNFKKGY